MGLSNELSCESGSFFCCLNPHRFFSVTGFEALFPHTGALGCAVCLPPQFFFLVYLNTNVGPPICQPLPRCKSSLPQLPVSTPHTSLDECSSLIPWLSEFHTINVVWYSGSSGYFFVCKFVVVFLWVCEEAKCIYVCLHLGKTKNTKFLSAITLQK